MSLYQKLRQLQLGYLLVLWLAALWLAWLLVAQWNFFYTVWYDWLAIDHTIAEYGPQNRYRQDFEQTSRAERERLLAALVSAIHNDGAGLDTLRYHAPDGKVLGVFLRPPEILHLQDVARLLNTLRWLGWAAVVIWLLLTVHRTLRRIPPPSPRRVVLSSLAVLVLLGIGVVLMGPVRVFYQLHIWIFPPGHPWFFYYQDSLMTTLLKAPDIFAPITLSWLLLSVLILALLLGLARVLNTVVLNTTGKAAAE